MKNLHPLLLFFLLCISILGKAQKRRITVSQDGKGDFTTVQGALASLSDSSSQTRVIFIRNGTYREKLYIEKHNIQLQGEERAKVCITYPQAREAWRCEHADDWGVATFNIDGNDITLQNLTVVNSFGFDFEGENTISCPLDTVNPQKRIAQTGHQMAVRTMKATRFKAINCTFRSYAGDTMSPWNVRQGLFYFKDCLMEGGVDLYCPRGWAYAENCTFVATKGNACIWHDGSQQEDSKTVLNHCFFDGYAGFQLGRYHRDAQFYLFYCQFSQHMADQPIYRVPTQNTLRWGHRVYYYDCHKIGKEYAWYADNIASAPQPVNPLHIGPEWVFGTRWNPLEN